MAIDLITYEFLKRYVEGANMGTNANPRGKWSANTEYNTGDYVTYRNEVYIALEEHTSTKNNPPSINENQWQKIFGINDGGVNENEVIEILNNNLNIKNGVGDNDKGENGLQQNSHWEADGAGYSGTNPRIKQEFTKDYQLSVTSSNASELDENGNPVKDENGKVKKRVITSPKITIESNGLRRLKPAGAYGITSTAMGEVTTALGDGAWAEGQGSIAQHNFSHAEGLETWAAGYASHTEGMGTYTENKASHAEGYQTEATGEASHAEGTYTYAAGHGAHAEGIGFGNATNQRNQAIGEGAHSEGKCTYAEGEGAHAEGRGKYATTDPTSATAGKIQAIGAGAHAEGYTNVTSYGMATGTGAHSEGYETKATAQGAHSEGQRTQATGTNSHTEGYGTQATGNYSHAEGQNTKAIGSETHAEGYLTQAIDYSAHAEGRGDSPNGPVIAKGIGTHAEGYSTVAIGQGVHSEGFNTIARGNYSHAEGSNNIIGQVYEINDIIKNTNITISSGSSKPQFGQLDSFNSLFGFNATKGNYTTEQEYTVEVPLIFDKNDTYLQCNFGGSNLCIRSISIWDEGKAKKEVTTTEYSSYSANTEYTLNSIVSYNGTYYRATKTTKGNLPTNQTYWTTSPITLTYNDYVSSNKLVLKFSFKFPKTYSPASTQLIVNQFHGVYGNTVAAHVSGLGNISKTDYQTVIGKYNAPVGSTPFVIGWGTNEAVRKNIMTVDTSGNLVLTGNITFKYNGTTYNLGEILSTLGGK